MPNQQAHQAHVEGRDERSHDPGNDQPVVSPKDSAERRSRTQENEYPRRLNEDEVSVRQAARDETNRTREVDPGVIDAHQFRPRDLPERHAKAQQTGPTTIKNICRRRSSIRSRRGSRGRRYLRLGDGTRGAMGREGGLPSGGEIVSAKSESVRMAMAQYLPSSSNTIDSRSPV